MMLYISVKFHKKYLGRLSTYSRATKLNCQISKENYSKTIKTRVMVLVVCMLSDDVLYFYEVS